MYEYELLGNTSDYFAADITVIDAYNVSDYMEAQVWNIAKGDVFKAALASSNMEDFAVNEIDVWIGHDYGNYKWDVINDYYNYDLSKYE